MKRAIKTCSLLLVAFYLVILATCENPAGDGNNEEGEFTISLGNGSAGKAAAYPPDYPPAAIPTGNPLIEDLRFEITFTPVAVGNGEKKEFSFNGDETIGGKVKVGKYTVTMDVYEIADDSYLYATGSAENSPVEIKGGRINPIKVLLYDAHNARMPAISIQPTDTTLIQGGTGTLTIGVLPPTDTGTLASLSYQWYSNTTPSNSGGTVLNSSSDIANGSQTETFSPDTAAIGTFYYYVVVTNTNLSVTGNTTTDAISNVATVGVILSTSFVDVIDITGVPTTATTGTPHNLFPATAAVFPSNATNQTITWSVQSTGMTGATIAPGTSTLNTTAAGTAIVRATVANGLPSADFWMNFTITVTGGPTPFGPVAVVSAGNSHTLAIKPDGSLWAWGNNAYGQLGLGDNNNRNVPVRVGTATDWASVVASSDYHTVAIKTDGSLWAWGLNNNGRLGLGDTTSRNVPVQVGSGMNWAVVATSKHTIAIKTDGSLWTWGINNAGQLGLGDTTDRNVPVQVGTNTDWASVTAGTSYTIAIKTNGSLWAWGLNSSGRLGLGDDTIRYTPVQVGSATDWAQVAAGESHTVAIKTDGSLWAWGVNTSGQLGLGQTGLSSSTPVRVGSDTWASVASGERNTFAIKPDSSLWAWGYNNIGQLGLGDYIDRNTPEQVETAKDWASGASGGLHALAIKTDGSLWAWGGNGYGQLGVGNTILIVPTQVME